MASPAEEADLEHQAERDALLGTLRGALERLEALEQEKEKLVRGVFIAMGLPS